MIPARCHGLWLVAGTPSTAALPSPSVLPAHRRWPERRRPCVSVKDKAPGSGLPPPDAFPGPASRGGWHSEPAGNAGSLVRSIERVRGLTSAYSLPQESPSPFLAGGSLSGRPPGEALRRQRPLFSTALPQPIDDGNAFFFLFLFRALLILRR